jgi:hypothetical protein
VLLAMRSRVKEYSSSFAIFITYFFNDLSKNTEINASKKYREAAMAVPQCCEKDF